MTSPDQGIHKGKTEDKTPNEATTPDQDIHKGAEGWIVSDHPHSGSTFLLLERRDRPVGASREIPEIKAMAADHARLIQRGKGAPVR